MQEKLNVEKKIREDNQEDLYMILQDMDSQFEQLILNEKKQREKTEVTLIKLLEDTCNKIESNLRIWLNIYYTLLYLILSIQSSLTFVNEVFLQKINGFSETLHWESSLQSLVVVNFIIIAALTSFVAKEIYFIKIILHELQTVCFIPSMRNTIETDLTSYGKW